MKGGIKGSVVITGIFTSFVGLSAAISGITVVRLGDRINKLKLISICLAGAVLASIPMYFCGAIWQLLLFYVLMVFAVGAVEPLLQSYLCEHTPPKRRGVLFGIQAFVASMGWFFAPLTGSAISIKFGVQQIFLFTSCFFALSFFYSLIARSVGRRRSSPVFTP